jgi:hypothetical protein
VLGKRGEVEEKEEKATQVQATVRAYKQRK